jgi:hypothetical protein
VELEVMRCPRCGYEWRPKVPNPKECPRCKGRLDYKVPSSPRLPTPGTSQKIKEVSEKMATKRLPWIAAAVVIVVAVGLGSWVLLQPTATTMATVTVGGPWSAVTSPSGWGALSSSIAVGLLQGNYGDFGIENIFIMIHGKWRPGSAPETWVKDENYYENISGSGRTVNIPYERLFDILVVYKIRGDNVAYMRFENTYEYIHIPEWNLTENRLATTTDWEKTCPWHTENVTYGAVGKDYPSSWVRFYNYLDNYGNGFKLPAGGQITINPLTIYTWK